MWQSTVRSFCLRLQEKAGWVVEWRVRDGVGAGVWAGWLWWLWWLWWWWGVDGNGWLQVLARAVCTELQVSLEMDTACRVARVTCLSGNSISLQCVTG